MRYLFSCAKCFYFYVCHGNGLKMANVFVKEIDTNAEDKRPNLLDVIEERNRSLNKVPTLLLTSCIINVSVLSLIHI